MLLGEVLKNDFQVATADVERALKFQKQYGGRIGAVLINMGLITEDTLMAALARQLNLPLLGDETVDFSHSGKMDEVAAFLIARKWLPVGKTEDALFFATTDPLNLEVVQFLRDTACDARVCLVTEARFRELQNEYEIFRDTSGADDTLSDLDLSEVEVDKLRELASEAPIVNLVSRLIARGVQRGASDLHLEPYKNMYRVRLRIDGLLHDIDFLPLKMQLPVASRIKILSGMDIAERRRPQDGQISMKVASKDIDIRVSTLPLAEGESLVLRFLIKEAISYQLNALGLEADLTARLEEDITRTAGVILLTGPTGSGKTTTLYACLNTINSEDKKIITIEDPVEYRLEGINQIQVRPDIDYDFLTALRSILRQDPDILMVGEIRDSETARTAMQSSLTGHLVFSTLHTNDAPTTYTRLIDLGIEEYLINSSVISVIAQRLLRKLCPACARPDTAARAVIRTHRLEDLARRSRLERVTPRKPVGCPECAQTGYRGRIGIMEYLRCSEEIRALPKDGRFPVRARELMTRTGIRSLAEDGFLKYLKGDTSLDEVLRVTA